MGSGNKVLIFMFGWNGMGFLLENNVALVFFKEGEVRRKCGV